MEKILRELKLESLFPKFAAQRIEPENVSALSDEAANVLCERMALFSRRCKGFNSLQPETQYIISNPPHSFNCGKPLISPSSPLSPHVIFSNTSCSSSSKSSLIFFIPSPAWNRACLSVDEAILL